MATTVRHLANDLGLNPIAGHSGLDNKIIGSGVNRPGLELAGYFKYFSFERILVFGRGEIGFLNDLAGDIRILRLQELFLYNIPCIVVAFNLPIPQEMIDLSDLYAVPVLWTSRPTTRTINVITNYLEGKLSERVTKHGSLLEIYGIGVLILGRSGIGKSECSLELIKKGHRLIADDVVTIRKVSEHTVIGITDELIKYHMELRGLGIIDIRALFGICSVADSKKIELVVNLEEDSEGKTYDRLGLTRKAIDILGVKIPEITIPIHEGKNISIVIEAAALNEHLRAQGHDSASIFIDRLYKKINAPRGGQP
jgi:HPr kinase/phosphorylase